jgi:glucuronokinase
VIQVFEGLVYMDFSKKIMVKQGYGNYEPLDPSLLPKLYMAYREDLSEPTEIFHNNIRERFLQGDREVIDAMKYWAELAVKVRSCLLNRQTDKIGALLNANFDRRRKIYHLSEENIRMVETARSTGASAKFTGSGGAIVGTYQNEQMFDRLKKELRKLKIKIIKPRIVNTTGKTQE